MTSHLSNGEKFVEISAAGLCVETFGNPANPAILFIDGAAASMLWREAELSAQMLDESLEILTAAWSGSPVHHHGQHYTVDGISFLPRPVQRPGVPVWAAGYPGNVKPLRRAARHDGFFPINIEHPDQLADIVTTLTDLRQRKTTRYDIAVALPRSADPAPYARAGATWWLAEFEPETVSLDQVRGVLRDGPADIDIERTR